MLHMPLVTKEYMDIGRGNMSNTDQHKDARETLDFNDVVRFFAGVPIKAECPACSSVSWEIPVAKDQSSRVLLNDSGFALGGKEILELKLSCNVCGFYRSHKAAIVKAWIEKNPPKAGNGDE